MEDSTDSIQLMPLEINLDTVPDFAKARLEKCRICCHFKYGRICANCGCQMTLKAQNRDERCPIGKW